jgi:hypothetical protein
MAQQRTATNQFILKTLAAEEIVVTIQPGMTQLSDLRKTVLMKWRLPEHLQVYITGGRRYADYTDHLLQTMIDGQIQDEGCLKIMWLCWMGDDGYHLVYTGGMCLENELGRKQAHAVQHGHRFEAITLRAWRVLSAQSTERFQFYYSLTPDDNQRDW